MPVDAQPQNLDELTLLGQSGAKAQRKLETFQAPAGIEMVEFVAPEGTSVCPVTGQPDMWEATIRYQPLMKCLESKSLKLYLQSFRNEAVFSEALAVQIRNDLLDALNPEWIEVQVRQRPRGGIELVAVSSFGRDS